MLCYAATAATRRRLSSSPRCLVPPRQLSSKAPSAPNPALKSTTAGVSGVGTLRGPVTYLGLGITALAGMGLMLFYYYEKDRRLEKAVSKVTTVGKVCEVLVCYLASRLYQPTNQPDLHTSVAGGAGWPLGAGRRGRRAPNKRELQRAVAAAVLRFHALPRYLSQRAGQDGQGEQDLQHLMLHVIVFSLIVVCFYYYLQIINESKKKGFKVPTLTLTLARSQHPLSPR